MPASVRTLSRGAIAAALVACAACGQPAPPDIILVSLDTLRRDQVGLYGGAGDSLTPTLDALGGESVVFEDAWAQVPFTLPSHMSIFTGLYPDVHGVERKTARLQELESIADLAR